MHTLPATGLRQQAEMLASLHARCRDIVQRHGGLAGEPRGSDGVMNYFGHPSALEDAAEHAVEAGLQIVQTVAELGVAVRVGIATGPVAALLPNARHEYRMHAAEPGVFAVRPEGTDTWLPVTFYRLDDGTPYVHYGARAARRVTT